MTSISSSVPAIKPPTGVVPDFTGSNSLYKWNTLCVSLCIALTGILFFLRTYVRVGIKRCWILEDWMCSLSWIGLVAFCGLITTSMHYHGGVHEWDLAINEAHQADYWFNVASIVYGPAILFTKIAILLLYRRVFVPMKSGIFDWAIRSLMLILTGFYIAITFVKIWECSPRARIWDKSLKGSCMRNSDVLNTSGAFNTATDLIILLIPVRIVWTLHMGKKRKLGVILVFTVGLLAPVFSLVGLIMRAKVSNNRDTTYHQPIIQLWAAAEISTGVICVCIPTLAPILRRRRPPYYNQSKSSGRENIRHMFYMGSVKDPAELDEINLFDNKDMTPPNGLQVPPAAVITKITGGPNAQARNSMATGMNDIGSARTTDEVDRTNGILTTVKMEHNYV